MADFSSLKAGLSGAVIFQSENNKNFQEEIEGTWNAVIRTRQPCAFVRVASVKDVVNTVKFCVHNKVSHAIQNSELLGTGNLQIQVKHTGRFQYNTSRLAYTIMIDNSI